MTEFHFLRPEWLWGFAVFLLLPFLAGKTRSGGGLWQDICDRILLRSQLVAGSVVRLFWPFFLISVCWALALFALAGPAWEKLPQPAVKKGTDTVYLLDISVFMTPVDVKPSRMDRARFKMHDFLQETKDGQNALILYDNEPFVAVPLTTDQKVIEQILPTVQAGMMGGRMPDVNLALQKAGELLKQAGAANGRIVLLGGYICDDEMPQVLKTAEKLKKEGYALSVLGIGTDHGAPLQMPDGAFLMHEGKPVLSSLSNQNMNRAAQAGGGIYRTITLDEEDVRDVIGATSRLPNVSDAEPQAETKADTWKDFGSVLCILILPFAAFGYRRGWLGGLMLFIVFSSSPAFAWQLSDLWTRPDRREAERITAGEKPQDPAVFKDNAWRGAAAYKAGDYQTALTALNDPADAEMRYNQGNALAQAGQYRQAIEAYKKVLEENPGHADAAFNKKYLEDQLKNNQNQQQQDQQQQNQQQQDQKQDQQQQDRQQDQQQQDQKQDQQQQDQQQDQKQDQQQQDRQQDQQQQDQKQDQQQQDRQQQDQQQQNQSALNSEQRQEENQRPDSQQKAPPEQKTDQDDQEKQEQRQWLSVIEDDPSGLLRARIRRRNLIKGGRR